MSKVKTTVTIEASLKAALNKICVRTGDQTWHIEQALRAYGPIKKLLAKVDAPLTRVPAIAKGFTRPSIVELASYFHEIGSLTCNDDANSFFDHFESNGWKVGKAKNPMKCWKAAARMWLKRKSSFASKAVDGGKTFVEKHSDDEWSRDL
jgi:hypothetical protein